MTLTRLLLLRSSHAQNLVVGLGFLAAAVVMGSVMTGGFLTFGAASQGAPCDRMLLIASACV